MLSDNNRVPYLISELRIRFLVSVVEVCLRDGSSCQWRWHLAAGVVLLFLSRLRLRDHLQQHCEVLTHVRQSELPLVHLEEDLMPLLLPKGGVCGCMLMRTEHISVNM